ncbi:putative AIG1-type guanine nucleotide-binding (G) domain-containing protein [Helianthus anomalus]
MEESRIDDDWFTSSSRTLVLVGRPGNGKSATGNSILGKKAFVSKTSYAGVTRTSELRRTVLNDGLVLKVIDTPGIIVKLFIELYSVTNLPSDFSMLTALTMAGLFDSSIDIDFVKKEIVKCMNMASDGIHAILVILSVRNRFSKDEEAAIRGMRILFGSSVYDYMIVLYTGGDELEESGQTLEEYLEACPDSLKETISLCGHRCMLFDNKTNDQQKRTQQLHDLLSHVNNLLTKSNGKPYTDESLRDLKKGIGKLHEYTNAVQGYSKLEITENQVNEMIALRLKETTAKLEQQLAEEQSRLKEATRRLEQQLEKEQGARLKAEKMAHTAQTKSNDEIRKLRENLERAERETEELRNKAKSGKCAIL